MVAIIKVLLAFDNKRGVKRMTIQQRVSKKGVVSYCIRVSLGYTGGQQVIKSMTWKPDEGMKPKAVDKELNRIAVLFEENRLLLF